MRCFLFAILLLGSIGVWAQSSSGSQSAGSQSGNRQSGDGQSGNAPSGSSPAANSQTPDGSPATAKPAKSQTPDLSPPRSDRININDLGSELGESSSKDTEIDTSAPENDVRAHPQSAEAVAEAAAGGSSVGEFHPWDPHKAAKDVEVGNYYFNRKNYKAAEDRYREALYYKENDAEATFHLAECLQKMERPGEALTEYESYLKILPSGPHARATHEAIEVLRAPTKSRPAK